MAQCLAPDDADGQFLLHQMAEITQNLEIAIDSVISRSNRTRTSQNATPSLPPSPRPYRPPNWREKLRANWNAESLMLRHAIRITAVCGLEVWILYHFHISHGYWLPLTSLIVLQPHLSGTFRRSLQRMGGTIGGGILAAVLAVFLHSQISMAAAIFPDGPADSGRLSRQLHLVLLLSHADLCAGLASLLRRLATGCAAHRKHHSRCGACLAGDVVPLARLGTGSLWPAIAAKP